MSNTNLDIEKYVAGELEKYGNIYIPIRASFLETLLVKSLKCTKIHPNPDDEFCNPKIGPSTRIMHEYEVKIHNAMEGSLNPWAECGDPLIVEKIHPDGYMLLNGHHRWGAAMRVGLKKVPVKIVYLTYASDVENMLKKSKNDKRVTFDLDEIVFRKYTDDNLEKELLFPLNRIYKERIRVGFPALCHYLVTHGYDIWVYTSHYYSINYIKYLFKRYHVKLTGIITGTNRKSSIENNFLALLEQKIDQQYKLTVNIYDDEVIFIDTQSGKYEQKSFEGSDLEWSSNVKAVFSSVDND